MVDIQAARIKFCGVFKGEGQVIGKPAKFTEKTTIELLKTTDVCAIYSFTQRTKKAVDPCVPMHAENGFVRIMNDGKAHASFSHTFFVNEMEAG